MPRLPENCRPKPYPRITPKKGGKLLGDAHQTRVQGLIPCFRHI
jgi:hypothetical protein